MAARCGRPGWCLAPCSRSGTVRDPVRRMMRRSGLWRVRVLLPGGRFESDHQLGRYPAAVFDLDALGFGPLADLSGIQPARRGPPPGPCGPASSAAGPPPSAHITRKRLAQLLGVFFVQVDLVLGAVQPETDGSFGGAAVKVIDEQGLDLLGHSRLIPLTDPPRQCRQSDTGSAYCRADALSRYRYVPRAIPSRIRAMVLTAERQCCSIRED
jgi:hypothetical protein